MRYNIMIVCCKKCEKNPPLTVDHSTQLLSSTIAAASLPSVAGVSLWLLILSHAYRDVMRGEHQRVTEAYNSMRPTIHGEYADRINNLE